MAQNSEIESQLKELAKEEQLMAARRKELEKLQKEAEKKDAQLEKLFNSSGYATPRELVDALIAKYNLRMRRTKATVATGDKPRRKRTKVTPALRDQVKADLKGGMSMNAASKKYEVSYAVIAKMKSGGYDKLK